MSARKTPLASSTGTSRATGKSHCQAAAVAESSSWAANHTRAPSTKTSSTASTAHRASACSSPLSFPLLPLPPSATGCTLDGTASLAVSAWATAPEESAVAARSSAPMRRGLPGLSPLCRASSPCSWLCRCWLGPCGEVWPAGLVVVMERGRTHLEARLLEAAIIMWWIMMKANCLEMIAMRKCRRKTSFVFAPDIFTRLAGL